jgi:hypothetical protein
MITIEIKLLVKIDEFIKVLATDETFLIVGVKYNIPIPY